MIQALSDLNSLARAYHQWLAYDFSTVCNSSGGSIGIRLWREEGGGGGGGWFGGAVSLASKESAVSSPIGAWGSAIRFVWHNASRYTL